MSELENQLVECLRVILQHEDVAPDSSLFELGGTSVHAEVFARMASTLVDADLTIIDVFKHSSPRALAQHLQSDAT